MRFFLAGLCLSSFLALSAPALADGVAVTDASPALGATQLDEPGFRDDEFFARGEIIN